MAEEKSLRLSQVARNLNVGRNTIIETLTKKGFDVDQSPNSKITEEQYIILAREFASSANEKKEASEITIGLKKKDPKEEESVISPRQEEKKEDDEVLIKNLKSTPAPTTAKTTPAILPEEDASVDKPKLQGIKVLGKIDLTPPKKKKEVAEEPKETKEAPKPTASVTLEEAPTEETPPIEKEIEDIKKDSSLIAPEVQSSSEEESATQETIAPEIETPALQNQHVEEVEAAEDKSNLIEAKAESLKGLTVLGKIELPQNRPSKPYKKDKDDKKDSTSPIASSDERDRKKKRKRIQKPEGGPPRSDSPRPAGGDNRFGRGERGRPQRDAAKPKEELSDKEIQDQIKATLAKLSGGGNKKDQGNRSKYRKEKRNAQAEAREEQAMKDQESAKVLHVTEYISANDLASLLEVTVNEIISTCLSLGMFVSINQRLDAEAITIIADEFGYDVDFTKAEEETEVIEEAEDELLLVERPPIVTIMGHVDHGKTSLLDFIRKTKVTEGEAGGITQHIGAYDVTTSTGKRIAFLDTPGHEAFTAMRARGAKLTDVAIIVIAADDAVMPQTKEAINHAQLAEVPLVFAINKIDKPGANPEKIKEQLSQMNILVEDWGGKYQCQEISAKSGIGIDDLLEKVLLESELLELKANPNKKAVATVVEASLDKGRGYVTTVLVQSGTLRVGDVMLAGAHYGKVKAMFDHRGIKMEKAGPSTPVLVLGLDGAPQAGDKLHVMDSDKEARDIATKRAQIQREQSIRTKKHITLDEIGRRLAIGSFKELNVIVKGDVDGSVEALSDSLLKLSTEEVQVNIIYKAVGQISESDILLASASDAVIVAFQVRPSSSARRLAEAEEIEIRHYSIIYDAINDVKDAMEGMLAPEQEEIITGTAEIRQIFKISKVGTVAGCMVTEGNIKRANKIRLIRDGIVMYTGELDQLKRFKDDVAEVRQNFECGMSIKNYNDLREGDNIEGFEFKEVKRKL